MAEPTLEKGSKKPEVKDLQEALKAFGSATWAVVNTFEDESGPRWRDGRARAVPCGQELHH